MSSCYLNFGILSLISDLMTDLIVRVPVWVDKFLLYCPTRCLLVVAAVTSYVLQRGEQNRRDESVSSIGRI